MPAQGETRAVTSCVQIAETLLRGAAMQRFGVYFPRGRAR
jgi:hypothetical protein